MINDGKLKRRNRDLSLTTMGFFSNQTVSDNNDHSSNKINDNNNQ